MIVQRNLNPLADNSVVDRVRLVVKNLFALRVPPEPAIDTHDRDDAWINLYAIYSPVYHTLQMKYYIETDTSVSDPIVYEPTETERKIIMAMIEEKCREVENCSCVELLLEAANDDER